MHSAQLSPFWSRLHCSCHRNGCDNLGVYYLRQQQQAFSFFSSFFFSAAAHFMIQSCGHVAISTCIKHCRRRRCCHAAAAVDAVGCRMPHNLNKTVIAVIKDNQLFCGRCSSSSSLSTRVKARQKALGEMSGTRQKETLRLRRRET